MTVTTPMANEIQLDWKNCPKIMPRLEKKLSPLSFRPIILGICPIMMETLSPEMNPLRTGADMYFAKRPNFNTEKRTKNIAQKNARIGASAIAS